MAEENSVKSILIYTDIHVQIEYRANKWDIGPSSIVKSASGTQNAFSHRNHGINSGEVALKG